MANPSGDLKEGECGLCGGDRALKVQVPGSCTNLCEQCVRAAVAAWAKHTGPTWAIAVRQSMQRRDRGGVPQ